MGMSRWTGRNCKDMLKFEIFRGRRYNPFSGIMKSVLFLKEVNTDILNWGING